MKYLTLGKNPLAPSVTLSFQHQVVLLKRHELSHTRSVPFGAPFVTSSFQNQVLLLKGH